MSGRQVFDIREISSAEAWLIRHQVMWPNEPLDYVKLPNDDAGIHYGLFLGSQLTSVVSLFVINQEAQFRKLATFVSEQGHGFGTELLSHLFKQIESLEVKRIWCNARVDKASFYHRFGLKETAPSFVKNGQSYVVMEKTV